MDNCAELDKEVFLQSGHCGPILDVGTVAELSIFLRIVEAFVAALCIDGAVVYVLELLSGGQFVIEVGSCGKNAAVCSGSSDGTSVHQSDSGDLAVAGLGAFAVCEVTGCVTDGQSVVSGGITCTEARTAECGLHDAACLHELGSSAVLGDSQADGGGGGIYAHIEVAVADGLAFQDSSSLNDVLVHTAGAANDDALVAGDLAVNDVAAQIHLYLAAQLLVALFLDLCQDAFGVSLQLVDGVSNGGMEGQSDHTLNLVQIDLDNAVVVCTLSGLQLFVIFGTADVLVELLGDFVGCPDRGQAGSLGGHNVNTDSEVGGQVLDAGAYELEDLVLNVALGECCSNQSDSNVLRTYALAGLAIEVNHNNFGSSNVIGVLEQLLYQLAAAFTNAHAAVGAVTGVGVRTQNHLAAASQTLTSVLMDNSLVSGNVDTAVLACCGQTESVVVLIDCAANCAKAVVAVGHCVGDGELLQTGSLSGLDDTNKSDIVRNQSVELDSHLLGICALVVSAKNRISDGLFSCSVSCFHALSFVGPNDLVVYQIGTFFDDFYHVSSSNL